MRRAIPLVCVPLLWVACGGSPAAPRTTASASRPDAMEGELRDGGWLVSSVPPGTFGPHWAQRGEDRLAAWAIPDGPEAGWYSLTLPQDGPPRVPQRFADVAAGLEMIRVRPDGAVGFAVLTTRRVGEANLVESLHLGSEGMLRSGPHIVAESPSPVLWVDSIPTPRGVLAVWAERAGARADVYVASIGPLGVEQPARRVVRQAVAWQFSSFGRAGALATIEEVDSIRRLVVRFIGDDGKDAAPEVVVPTESSPGGELDLLVTQQRTVLAWTERQATGRRLMLAQLDTAGRLEQTPWPATPPRGDQSLVELVGSQEGTHAYLAWEEEGQRPLTGSSLLLAAVGAVGETLQAPTAELSVDGYDGTLPLFAAGRDGLVVGTRGTACRDEGCDEGIVVAVGFNERLKPVGALPVSAGGRGEPAQFLWDLQCNDGVCWSLSARSEGVTRVYFQRLLPETSWRGPATFLGEEARPRMVSRTLVSEVMDLAGLQAWQGPRGPVVSWVSYFDPSIPWEVPKKPAPDGRLAPVRAVLRTQSLKTGSSSEQLSMDHEETVSWRAHSLGGLAASVGARGETLLAWSALDNQEPQVFATIVDAQGKRLKQRMVTHAPGEVLDVAAVPLETGWLLSWVDGRGPTFELYTVLLDERLESRGAEAALNLEARNPNGLQMLRRGDGVLLTWSDAAGLDPDDQGDIYVAVISVHDGSLVAPARRVAATPRHSHSPRLVPYGEGALLGWVDSEIDLEKAASGAFWMLPLDEGGRFRGAPRSIELDGGPQAFTMSCDVDCRVALVLDAGSRSELWGLSWNPSPSVGVIQDDSYFLRFLTALQERYSDKVAPLLLGDDMLFVDGDHERKPWLHRLQIDWP